MTTKRAKGSPVNIKETSINQKLLDSLRELKELEDFGPSNDSNLCQITVDLSTNDQELQQDEIIIEKVFSPNRKVDKKVLEFSPEIIELKDDAPANKVRKRDGKRIKWADHFGTDLEDVKFFK